MRDDACHCFARVRAEDGHLRDGHLRAFRVSSPFFLCVRHAVCVFIMCDCSVFSILRDGCVACTVVACFVRSQSPFLQCLPTPSTCAVLVPR